MPKTVSDSVLVAINAAEDALMTATEADATVANDLVSVELADEQLATSQEDALSKHSTATALAREAIRQLKAELQLQDPAVMMDSGSGSQAGDGSGLTTPKPEPRMGEICGQNYRKQTPQHPAITHALNLGIPWDKILQALLKGGLSALKELTGG